MVFRQYAILLICAVLASAAAQARVPWAERLPDLAHENRDAAPAVGDVTLPANSLLNRSLRGVHVPLPLGWGGADSPGNTRLIGGATSASGTTAVSGGLLWNMDAGDGDRLHFGVLNSGMGGDGLAGGETLAMGGLDLALGAPYYVPDVALEYAAVRMRDDAPGPGSGAAAGLSLRGGLADGRYQVRVVRADRAFRALGATVPAGRTLTEVTGNYPLFDDLRLHGNARWFRDQHSDSVARGWSHRAGLSTPAPAALSAFNRVRVDASSQYHEQRPRQWELSVGGDGVDWQLWQLNAGLSWETRPLTKREQRYGGLLRGHRPVRVGGFTGKLRSDFGLRRLVGGADAWSVNTGVGLHLDRPERDWNLRVDYSADPWTRPVGHGGDPQRVMVTFGINGGAAAEPVRGPFHAFRRGGQRLR